MGNTYYKQADGTMVNPDTGAILGKDYKFLKKPSKNTCPECFNPSESFEIVEDIEETGKEIFKCSCGTLLIEDLNREGVFVVVPDEEDILPCHRCGELFEGDVCLNCWALIDGEWLLIEKDDESADSFDEEDDDFSNNEGY